jgi:hypothetical protein
MNGQGHDFARRIKHRSANGTDQNTRPYALSSNSQGEFMKLDAGPYHDGIEWKLLHGMCQLSEGGSPKKRVKFCTCGESGRQEVMGVSVVGVPV